MLPRSYLYVPGDAPAKLDKAAERGADALIVDLEDSVAPARKDAARDAVSDWLSGTPAGDVELWVRVNNDERLHRDLEAVLSPRLRGIVLPKATAASVRHVTAWLAERRPGNGEPALGVFILLETAAAFTDLEATVATPSVARVGIGEADLRAELGIAADEALAWAPIRSRVVVAAAAAGIDPPVASTSTDFRDLDALRESTRLLARVGFRGRTAIHPAQVPVINEVFTPTDEEVEAARRTVERFDEAAASGAGVAIADDGRMIDEAVVRSARRTLALARPRD